MIESYGGMAKIAKYLGYLTRYVVTHMKQLVYDVNMMHSNTHDTISRLVNRPLCVVYGNHELNPVQQGPIITFNIIDPLGDCVIGYHTVYKLAMKYGIVLRTGCFCNVGGCQEFLHITNNELVSNFQSGRTCYWEDVLGNGENNDNHTTTPDIINGKPTGAVRVSLGELFQNTNCNCIVTLFSLM